MSWLEKNGFAVVNLNEKVALLVAMGVINKELRSQGLSGEYRQVIEYLNQLLFNGTNAQAVKNLLSANDLKPVVVIQQWKKFRDRIEESIGEQYQALVYPLYALKSPPQGISTEIEWPLLEKGLEHNVDPSSKTSMLFTLSGEGKVEVEASPVELPKALPKSFSVPDAKQLVRIGMQGGVQAGVDINATVNVAEVSLGTEHTIKATANWYFSLNHDALFATAFAEGLKKLQASPFKLDELSSVLKDDNNPLVCLAINADGGQSFSGGLKVNKLVLPGLAGTSVSADFNIRVVRNGEFRYLLYSDEGASPVLSLRRGRLKQKDRSHSFAVFYDFTPSYLKFRDLILERTDKLSSLLEKVENVLPRDDLLQKEISKYLDEKLADAPMGAFIKASLGFDPDRTGGQLLAEYIMTEVETSSSRWGGDASSASHKLVESIIGKLDLSGNTAASLQSMALSKIEEIIKNENQRLENKLKEYITTNSGWKELVSRLDDIGETVQLEIEEHDERLNTIIGPIRHALENYQKQVKKLSDALEAATEAKLKIKWSKEQTKAENTVVDLKVRFLSSCDTANDLYQRMLSGSLNSLRDYVTKPNGERIIEVIEGELQDVLGLKSSRALEISLFGLSAVSERSVDTESAYAVNNNGDVRVMSRAEIVAQHAAIGESRRLRFVDAYELAVSKETRSLDINLTLSQNDENVTGEDIEGFFYSLEEEGLLIPGTTEKALQRLVDLNDLSPGARVKGKLEMDFLLPPEAIDRLLGRDQTGRPLLTDEAIMHTVALELMGVDNKANIFGNSYKERKAKIKKYFPKFDPPLPTDLYSLIIMFNEGVYKEAWNQADDIHENALHEELHLKHDLKTLHQYHNHAVNIQKLVNELRSIYHSYDNPHDWSASAYNDAQSRLDDYMTEWLKVDSVFFFFLSNKVRPLTVAFIRIMVLLSGTPLSQEYNVVSAKLILANEVYDLTAES